MNIKRKLLAGLMAACMTAGLATGLTACGNESADGTVNLTFQIWDVAQRDGDAGDVRRLHRRASQCPH